MTKRLFYRLPIIKNTDATFCLFCLTLLSVILAPVKVTAHPHAFAFVGYTIVFDESGFTGVQVFWVLDEMYSALTGSEFDRNGNGRFEEEESRELRELANEILPDSSFFTHIEVDGKPYGVQEVDKFTISYENGIMYYKFFVSCKIPAGKEKHHLKISPYDPEYYIAMFFSEKGSLMVENGDTYDIKTKIDEDPKTRIYFDMIHPQALFLEFQRKN